MSDVQEDDPGSLYAVLNVTRDASDAEIKRAYRNLAQLYHPDKQIDPSLKQLAETSFTRIQAAYEASPAPLWLLLRGRSEFLGASRGVRCIFVRP